MDRIISRIEELLGIYVAQVLLGTMAFFSWNSFIKAMVKGEIVMFFVLAFIFTGLAIWVEQFKWNNK